MCRKIYEPAHVMELVDVGDSKSPGSDTVPVRVRPWALFNSEPNLLLQWFGFLLTILKQCNTIWLYFQYSSITHFVPSHIKGVSSQLTTLHQPNQNNWQLEQIEQLHCVPEKKPACHSIPPESHFHESHCDRDCSLMDNTWDMHELPGNPEQ